MPGFGLSPTSRTLIPFRSLKMGKLLRLEKVYKQKNGNGGTRYAGKHDSNATSPEDLVLKVRDPGCGAKMSTGKKFLDPTWRRSTVKVSPCVHCATQDSHERSKRYRAKAKCISPVELLECSMKLIKSYKQKRQPWQSPDIYSDIWLPLHNVMHPYDIQFVKQILYGCVRYEKLLNIFLDKLHERNPLLTSDDDAVYTVLAYLALLRLHELCWPQYRRLLWTQPPERMVPFLQFLFDGSALADSVERAWCEHYDIEFVQDMLESIRFFSLEAKEVCNKLAKRVYAGDQVERYVAPPTVPQPFNLSESKTVCLQDEGLLLPVPFKAKPAPKFEKARTLEMKRMSAVFTENRQILKQKYADPKFQPFCLRAIERPTNRDQLREEAEQKFVQDHQYIPVEVNAVPGMPVVEVKLNVATLLREHSLFKKKMEDDRKRIQSFEEELHNDLAFKHWSEEKRLQTKITKALDIQFSRKKVMATDQAAILAKEKSLAEKMELGKEAREEAKVCNVQILHEKKNEKFRKKMKHFLVAQHKRATKIALKKVLDKKRADALEVMAKSEELCGKSSLVKAQQMAMKQELVRQLRALEKESCHIKKKFDIYSSGGQGLLQEMSIAQLRTEVVVVKRWLQNEEDAKRKTIHAAKIERQNALLEKCQLVTQMRHVARAQWLSKKAAEK